MARTPRVVLVSMPWTAISEPSLGLAILKAQLESERIPARVLHLNLLLLRHITGATYQQIASCWALNEFVFTGAIDPDVGPEQAERLVERCQAHANPNYPQAYADPGDFGRLLIRLRHEIIPRYLIECAEEILAQEPTMVGFTCLFDQTMASIAVARLLRAARPDLQIVLGGYALEGPPGREVLRSFPWIDAVAGGDGEPIIGRLARASVGEGALDAIPGVMTRANPVGPPRTLYSLENSPTPDYADWFADLEALSERDKLHITTTVLPIESSRGCWWGQHQHCVFCGIDEQTLVYRRKKPETVIRLLAEMRDRYADAPYRFSDYILPNEYMTELLPALARVSPPYEMHCEIKANQSETRMAAFADAGFTEVQPGIESFDSAVLRLMKKGVRGIHNVQTLKLGYEHGILVNYNILYGIPGETADGYLRMTEQLPRLYHLTPPVTRTEAIVTRFAPLHASPAAFVPGCGEDFRPEHHKCYDTLFSPKWLAETGFDLDNYAYYFERYFDYADENALLYSLIVRIVDHWKSQHLARDVHLSWQEVRGGLAIDDARFSRPIRTMLGGTTAAVYRACDRAPVTTATLATALDLTTTEIETAIEELDETRLIWREDNQVLGLAIPAAIVDRHRHNGWRSRWTSVYS